MANVYARITKITNAVGRSSYIKDKDRQEEIVLYKKEMKYSWKEHSDFEKNNQKTNTKNNEALEVHFALPNVLANNKEKLKKICDDIANKIVGENKDYEYAVHWNHTRTNLHCHILFSERENKLELEPKIYKRDIYYNFEEKKLSKKTDPKAEIIHHKGEVQKDNEGNIKYSTDIFKTKDKQYVDRNYSRKLRIGVQGVLNAYGYDLSITDENSPYIAQKKLYKGASADYLEKAKSWNREVKKYNEAVKRHIELEPIQKENYIEIKKELILTVKEANSEEKKITTKAINLIKEMSDWVIDTVNKLTVYLKEKLIKKESENLSKELKEKVNVMFSEYKTTEKELKEIDRETEKLKVLDNSLEKILEEKQKSVDDIVEQQERKKAYEWDIEL